MKYLLISIIVFVMTAFVRAQTPPPQPSASAGSATMSQKDAEQLATRMLQLIESTAVSVPGLVRASEPVKQNAEMTLTSMQRTPLNPALIYQFINQVKAYLALSDSIPRPFPFPQTADQQFSELREGLQRIQQHFEAILQVQNQGIQARDSDPENLKRYAEANTKVMPPGKLPRIVFLGDSITDGWRLNEYFTGRDFINRGISGQTTIQMLGRFMEDVVSLHPKEVLILAGTNDIARGIPTQSIEDNLSMMGELAKAHNIKVLFASILPVSDYHKDADPRYEMTKTRPPATIEQINRWLQEYCTKQGFVYVDYYSAMVDDKNQMKADLADDGLHPNSKGYRVMSPIALEAIGRALSPPAPEPPEERAPGRRLRPMSK
jgi:acyl-CoA thioesterase-1